MTFLQLDYAALALSVVEVVLGVAVLIIAKLALGILSPYATDHEMTTKDNPAFGLAIAGYFGAVVMVYLAAAAGAPLPLDQGVRAVLVAIGVKLLWALIGVVALNLSRWLMDRLLIPHFRNDREIADRRNLAAGALEAGAYIVSGAVLAGAIRQPGGNLWTALAIFLLAQLMLILMGWLYQKWTGYNVAAEIRSGNFAAGVGFAMTMAALSLLMVKAISGDFVSWTRTLTFFAFDTVVGLILLLFLRWLTAATLLPHARVADEIVRDRNVNVSLVEGVLAVGIAAIILLLF
ncbi:MAG: DUF350 domain-containing protein [Bryobacterales bacterium]|nr:DUF350 domain-containing protein [Bryobacterales bacterium]MBV9398219.1 DUF350 domain-containing protein [Bryobacterales bacterium]